jgi:uncharacterized membrane protein
MSFGQMSQTRLRAWLATFIWLVAGAGFFLTFFTGGGAGDFDTDSGRHLAGAAAIAFGFLAYWTVLWRTRQRGQGLVADERDVQVVARAGQTTLVIVLVGIFGFTIGLWTVYEGAGVVPVGWMWFLAYGSVILASVTFAVATLVLDGRMGGHG